MFNDENGVFFMNRDDIKTDVYIEIALQYKFIYGFYEQADFLWVHEILRQPEIG